MSGTTSGRLIFAMTALSIFSLLVVLMGASFSDIETQNYELIEIPDDIKSAMFWDYNVTEYNNVSITVGLQNVPVPAGADDYVRVSWTTGIDNLYMSWVYGKFLWFFKNDEAIAPWPLSLYDIIDGYDDETNCTVIDATSAHQAWLIQFAYNQTAYTDIEDSINNNELYLFIGKGNDLSPTKMSAWSLVTSILLWKNPDIHPAVNFVLAVPLYSLMAVAFFEIFTRVIEVLKPFG